VHACKPLINGGGIWLDGNCGFGFSQTRINTDLHCFFEIKLELAGEERIAEDPSRQEDGRAGLRRGRRNLEYRVGGGDLVGRELRFWVQSDAD